MARDPITGGVQAPSLSARERARRRTLARDRGYFTEGKRVLLRRHALTHKRVLEQPFFFQVPPLEDVTISHAHTHTDYTTLARRTLSRPDSLGLRVVTINSMFVDYEASFAVHHRGAQIRPDANPDTIDTIQAGIEVTGGRGMGAFQQMEPVERNVHFLRPRSPLHVTDQLREVLGRGTPFWLYIGDVDVWGRWDLRMLATLRALDVTDRAGEPDTRYVSAQFTEFRQPAQVRRDRRVPRYHPKLPAKVRVYEDGYWTSPTGIDERQRNTPMTLHNLSTLFYGSPGKWRLIARASGIPNWPASKDLAVLAQERTKARKIKGHGGHVVLWVPKVPHEAGLVGLLVDRDVGVALVGEVELVDRGLPFPDLPDVEGDSGGVEAPD